LNSFILKEKTKLRMKNGGYRMIKSLLFLLSVLMITGCAQNKASTPQAPSEMNGPQQMSVKNKSSPNEDSAQHLVNLAKQNPNVLKAQSIVIGPYAVVAIDVKDHLDRSEVGSIKYTVSEVLKKDPEGKSAIVIADPDLYERIRELKTDIKNGKPIRGIMNELADITGRVMPEIPKDLIDPHEQEQPGKKTNELNQKGNNQLQREQKDQVHH
jgi:YhcN/YlaJ family sporulation lipoprotein